MKIAIEVTARHIHIKRDDLEVLFGKGYQLTKYKNISQPRMYASQETLDIKSEKAIIKKVRIVGPERAYTQVELSATDAYNLGLKPPIRESGDLAGSPGVVLIGPCGLLKLKEGVILAQRHIHLSSKEAEALKLKDGDRVKVEVKDNPKSLIFKNVLVRVHENFKLSMHVDADEGNAAGIEKVGYGEILRTK